MGIKVSASTASRLVGRSEKWIRARIEDGQLAASRFGNAWMIDVDVLKALPDVRIHQDRLAEIEAREAPGELRKRLATMEDRLRELSERVQALEVATRGAVAPATRGP